MSNIPTYADIISAKSLTQDKRLNELHKLIKYKAIKNEYRFICNRFIYHHQIDNLCRVKVRRGKSFFDAMQINPERCYAEALKRRTTGPLAIRILEAYRANYSGAFIFKAATAKWLYKHYDATRILDPCAGWGGRLVAAWSCGLSYVGIDTNTDLQPAYNQMEADMRLYDTTYGRTTPSCHMLWESCLSTDFSEIPYDFVLTSPPYANLELYPHMVEWKTKNNFYETFLMPLIRKCLKYIMPGGRVCFNISPSMYDDILKLGFPPCVETHDLLQRKSGHKIYVWRSNAVSSETTHCPTRPHSAAYTEHTFSMS